MFRKPTNRDDFIHYYSAHNNRIKTGVVIGFFLRALRICSSEYLNAEIAYIKDAFHKLKYPNGLLSRLLKKSREIFGRNDRNTEGQNSDYLTVPMSLKSTKIDEILNNNGMYVAKISGRKIGDIVRHKKSQDNESNTNESSIIYRIPCKGCDSSYIRESSRGLATRLSEHKNDIRHHRTSNSLVLHIDSHGHLPNWEEVEILQKGLNRSLRKTAEAAYITISKTINHREGFVKLSNVTSNLIVNSLKKAMTVLPRAPVR